VKQFGDVWNFNFKNISVHNLTILSRFNF
jgi:hypothetical protein